MDPYLHYSMLVVGITHFMNISKVTNSIPFQAIYFLSSSLKKSLHEVLFFVTVGIAIEAPLQFAFSLFIHFKDGINKRKTIEYTWTRYSGTEANLIYLKVNVKCITLFY